MEGHLRCGSTNDSSAAAADDDDDDDVEPSADLKNLFIVELKMKWTIKGGLC